MKVLLIGNGFDLYHSFPTKYLNFLHVTRFLAEHYDFSMKTVGDVFNCEELKSIDKDISKSYTTHRNAYHATPLDAEKIKSLIDIVKSNLWYNYFNNSFNKTLNWIDFEREISSVIDVFRNFFDELRRNYDFGLSVDVLDILDTFFENNVISHFDFFYKKQLLQDKSGTVIPPYMYLFPQGSTNYEINKDLIISDLFLSLRKCAEALSIYLDCFVNAPAHYLSDTAIRPVQQCMNRFTDDVDYLISFNYTNTFELFYSSTYAPINIHGNIASNIVIGVNPDKYDNLPDSNTDFIPFKKYYQRVLYETDLTYLSAVSNISTYLLTHKSSGGKVDLHVVGHSLDKTDEDIIIDIFNLASTITIYYHDIGAVGSYIKNLTSIFEKRGFDELRRVKTLRFVELPVLNWSDSTLPF